MSQSDSSLFYILIRCLFFIMAFGFGFCLVHVFYRNVSGIKVVYNFVGKVVNVKNKLGLILKN